MHVTPKTITCNIMKIYKDIRGKSIQFIDVIPDSNAIRYDCHNNCCASIYPRVLGFYVVMDLSVGCYSIIKHSVIRRDDKLIDITPSGVDRILFIETGSIEGFNYRFYSYLGEYLYMDYSELKNLTETTNGYYVYGLIDPRDEKIFYIGKGKNNRWLEHTREPFVSDGTHKSNKIKKIHETGNRIGVVFLGKNIEDESEAYRLEAKYISEYGRIIDGGILTNITLDGNPPNHAGKSYEEIYGDNAEYQRSMRAELQRVAGGWFKGFTHTDESRSKIAEKSIGTNNGNSCKLTEEDYLEYSREFCEMFNYKISCKRWSYFCEINNIPTVFRTFRFNHEYILDVICKYMSATIVNESQMWYNNGEDQIRLAQWQLDIQGIPEGYIPGRIKRKKEQ